MFLRMLMAGAAVSGALLAAPARAEQPTAEQLATIYAMTRNQQGLFEYCEGQGMVNPRAVALQRDTLALLPAPANPAAADAAYAQGRAGTMVAGPQSIGLAEAARAQGITEKGLCDTMAEAVTSLAATLPPG